MPSSSSSHTRLCQAEVQRVVAALREEPVHVDKVANLRDLGRDDDAIVRHPGGLGELG